MDHIRNILNNEILPLEKAVSLNIKEGLKMLAQKDMFLLYNPSLFYLDEQLGTDSVRELAIIYFQKQKVSIKRMMKKYRAGKTDIIPYGDQNLRYILEKKIDLECKHKFLKRFT